MKLSDLAKVNKLYGKIQHLKEVKKFLREKKPNRVVFSDEDTGIAKTDLLLGDTKLLSLFINSLKEEVASIEIEIAALGVEVAKEV